MHCHTAVLPCVPRKLAAAWPNRRYVWLPLWVAERSGGAEVGQDVRAVMQWKETWGFADF